MYLESTKVGCASLAICYKWYIG